MAKQPQRGAKITPEYLDKVRATNKREAAHRATQTPTPYDRTIPVPGGPQTPAGVDIKALVKKARNRKVKKTAAVKRWTFDDATRLIVELRDVADIEKARVYVHKHTNKPDGRMSDLNGAKQIVIDAFCADVTAAIAEAKGG